MLLNLIMALATVICLFAQHGASAQFSPDSHRSAPIPQPCSEDISGDPCPLSLIVYQDAGTFDRETWYCQFGSFPRFNIGWSNSTPDLSQYRRICAFESAARWTSIFPVVFSAVLCFLIYIDWRAERVLIRTWKNRGSEWWDDEL